jgi:SAM-dependent methyltransferase
MAVIIALAVTLASSVAAQQPQQQPPVYVPEVGQQGKDVVWVPTPPELVEKMLDLAKVTSRDYVIDLGSGDGRNVIAAARRGARALGVEYNPDMVALSNRLAAEAGVADKAKFVQGDMFEADFSEATVMAMFLLPDNLTRLKPKMEKLRPGTRVVLNTFGMPGWRPDVTERIEGNCSSWCTALLYTLPAKPE